MMLIFNLLSYKLRPNHSWLKKSLTLTLTPLAFALSGLAFAQTGEIITYTGSEPLIPLNGKYSVSPTPDIALSNNIVTINFTAGSRPFYVAGGAGLLNSGTVSDNTVYMINGEVTRQVYGGLSEQSGIVRGNTVHMLGGTVTTAVFGGWSDGEVTGNTVHMVDGVVGDAIYGGLSSSGNVSNNVVSVTGGAAVDIAGGLAVSGLVSLNSVSIANVMVGNVWGGQSISNEVNGNVVEISNSTVFGVVYGGDTIDGESKNNQVIIMNDTQVYFDVYGGYSRNVNNATNNAVTVLGGILNSNVYGGASLYGDATGNTITITGGTVDYSVYGGRSFYAIQSGSANKNTVRVTGGVVSEAIYGGWSDEGNTTDNTVSIIGGEVGGDIVGGWSNTGMAINNTVEISSAATLSSGSSIYGGWSGNGSDSFTGNTLNILSTGVHVDGDIRHFEYLKFYLPSIMKSESVMLTVSGMVDLTDEGARSATIAMGIVGGTFPLVEGDKVILINATNRIIANESLNKQAVGGMQGVSLIYDFDLMLSDDESQLLAIVKKPTVNPQTKSLSEARLASAVLLSQGGELLSTISHQASSSHNTGTSIFGVMQGASLRYKTGSHADVQGVNMVLGASNTQNLAIGDVTLRTLVEAGWGSYDSYNSFQTAAPVHGEGDSRYYGVGLMGRLDSATCWYIEGSARLGRLYTDYQSHDLVSMGQMASYDSNTGYFELSLGVGKQVKLDENKDLELYGRYTRARVNGDTVSVVSDPIKLEAISSERLRVGVRYSDKLSTSRRFYVGLAYENELDGEAQGSVYGYRLDTPSLKGGSGILELGMTIHPQNQDRLTLDISVHGHAGQREGVTSSVKMNYAF